jgi:quercetin dioxygenase-like cupin family protein
MVAGLASARLHRFFLKASRAFFEIGGNLDGRIVPAAFVRKEVKAMKVPDPVSPPDLVTAEPEQTRVLLENERIRVLDVRVGAGQKQRMHSHPDHLVYPLSAYRIKHIAKDGSTSIGDRKQGEVVWIPAESHAGENVGERECHVLIIELKEA